MEALNKKMNCRRPSHGTIGSLASMLKVDMVIDVLHIVQGLSFFTKMISLHALLHTRGEIYLQEY